MSVSLGFSYERPPLPEHWERELFHIAPPSQFVTWLKLRYVTGDPWEPIGRWCIYQMRAPRLIRNRVELLAELNGPHPRRTGHYCAPGWCDCRLKLNAWRCCANRGSLTCKAEKHSRHISRDTWELFQETGHYGKLWWVIQGDRGGHRYQLDQIEAKVSKLMGGPPDTPAPGDLPYAEWDRRAFQKIVQLDRVRMWKHVTDYSLRNHEQMDAEDEREAQAARAAVWGWLESQVKQTVEKIGHGGCMALKDAARNEHMTKDEGRMDLEAIERDFIETAA